MPRPIANIGAGNPATYTLTGVEAFTVLAVTFSLIPEAGAGGDDFAWLDMRDPSGGIIYMQPLSPGDGANMFYSLAVDASEFATIAAGQPWFPQSTAGFGFSYVTQRLSPQTLYSGCTVNAYKTVGITQPPTDPLTAVSPFYRIPDLHLWVEDAHSRFDVGDVGNPILLGIAV